MLYNIREQKKGGLADYTRKRYEEAGIHPVVANVLVNRDIPGYLIDALISNPISLLEDPDQIAGFTEVTQKLHNVINRGYGKIHVFADYDPDGLTSGYIMSMFLFGAGVDCEVYFPERRDGYGIQESWVAQKLNEGSIGKDDVIVTVDNGITAHKAINFCAREGIEIIVTDHHRPDEKLGKPNCLCCDPFLDLNGLGHHLCGAGVAMKVVDRLANMLGRGHLVEAPALAAIGTVADMMPPYPENLAIIQMGMKFLNESDKSWLPNLKAFMKRLGIFFPVAARDISWKIGPGLNAPGRLGNFSISASLIFTDDKKYVNEAIEMNETRKNKTSELFKAAPKEFPGNVCFYKIDPEYSGLAGLVANKIIERENKPAIVYCMREKGKLAGSGRVPGYLETWDILQGLREQGYFSKVSGHAHAFGVELPSAEGAIEEAEEKFSTALEGMLQEKEPPTVDTEITLKDISEDLYNNLYWFPFYREEWSLPIFIIRNVTVLKVTASKSNSDNIKLLVKDPEGTVKDLWFWQGAKTWKTLGTDTVNLIGTIDTSLNGTEVTFTVKGMEKA